MSRHENTAIAGTSRKDLWGTVRSANDGDSTAIAKLREELRGPNADLLIGTFGDLARQAETSILEAMFGEQSGSKLIAKDSMNMLRKELGWNDSPRIEQLLIERVVLSWLGLHWAEILSAQATNCSFAQAKFNQDKIDRASKRYLSATKMLATVRKMALPIRIELKAEVNLKETKSAIGDRFAMLNCSAN